VFSVVAAFLAEDRAPFVAEVDTVETQNETHPGPLFGPGVNLGRDLAVPIDKARNSSDR